MKPPRGFSLVELLIAVGLGATLLAASLTALARTSLRHEESRAVARLDEQASFVFGVLEPELQMAGFGGLQPLADAEWPERLPAGALDCGSLTVPPPPVRVASGMSTLACLAHDGGAVAEAPVLILTRAAGREAEREPGRLQVLSRRALSTPAQVAESGALPATEAGSSLRNLIHAVYYLAAEADAGPGFGPALRIKELTAIAGRAAFRDTEIADGIEALGIDEGWRASEAADAPLQWSPPGERPARRPMEAVRISLLMRSDRPIGAARTTRFAFDGTMTERHDGYVRQAAVRDFTLRNVARRGLE